MKTISKEQVLALTEGYGEFRYGGDAQGDVRLEYARDVLAFDQRLKNMAYDMLSFIESVVNMSTKVYMLGEKEAIKSIEEDAYELYAKAYDK